MTVLVDAVAPPCATMPELYDDELMHNAPSRSDVTSAQWATLKAMRTDAHRRCAGCPLMVDCLYRAVVEVDVSGFLACTTERDRAAIRRQLGIEVTASSSAIYGAGRVGGGPIDHEVVMALRETYPKETCSQLAERLGCSTSTIKRHLRKARDEQEARATGDASRTVKSLPTMDAVLDAFDQLASSKLA